MEAVKRRKFTIGCLLLLVVNILWVASAESSRYIFVEANFDKPFFVTYVKASMFTGYLLVSVVHYYKRRRGRVDIAQPDQADVELQSNKLTEAVLEPVRFDARGESTTFAMPACEHPSLVEDRGEKSSERKSVSFSGMHQVHLLPASEAIDAHLARLPYEEWLGIARKYGLVKESLKFSCHLALLIFPLWFVANLSYSEALNLNDSSVVNILSSTSSLFTLIIASFLPASDADRFNYSKLALVIICVLGIYLVSWVDQSSAIVKTPMGIAWSLFGAFGYALYAVLLRRYAAKEHQVDMALFFGFVGLFSFLFLWPLLLLLHFYGLENLYAMPNTKQWTFILLNGFFGTVIAEYLWLKACFLTTSFMSTLSLTMIIPLTMIADKLLWKIRFSANLYGGTVLVMLSFVGATCLSVVDNWDPVSSLSKKCLMYVLKGRQGKSRNRKEKTSFDLEAEHSALLVTESSSC